MDKSTESMTARECERVAGVPCGTYLKLQDLIIERQAEMNAALQTGSNARVCAVVTKMCDEIKADADLNKLASYIGLDGF